MSLSPLRILCTCGETLLVRDGIARCDCGLSYLVTMLRKAKEQQAA